MISLIPAVLTIQLFMYIYEKVILLVVYFHGYTNDWTTVIFGIIVSMVFFILIGRSVIKYGSSGYIKIVDKIADKVPLLSHIYSLIKKLINLFISEKEGFSEIIFIEYPRKDIWVPAYVTNKIKDGYILIYTN